MINDIVETSNYIKGLTPIKRTTTKMWTTENGKWGASGSNL